MKVLVVGAGGREHALAWKIARSSRVEGVIVAPGNAGTAAEAGVTNAEVAADDLDGLLDLARSMQIDLTVVGPEAPLVAGIVDVFAAQGLRCFGPSARAARLEGSKAFSKRFMEQYGIPTAAYATFEALDEALAHVRERGAPMVVKADGLAAGKGVIVAHSVTAAEAAVRGMLQERDFGAAGQRVVIEDLLIGEEVSFIAMVDGQNILPLATSQDHKTRDEGDTGPNTGGMGAYSPAPAVTPEIEQRIMREVMEPVVRGMREEDSPYVGFLYAGLMIAADGTPQVLEFNCRLGDPETQPILYRLRSDLVTLLEAGLDGHLASARADWDPRAALGVVMAAGGYPGNYRQGDVIRGLPASAPEHLKVFHAGTALAGEQVVTNGGRVLCVVALGESVTQAQAEAYGLVEQIDWPDACFRRDIGYRAIGRGG